MDLKQPDQKQPSPWETIGLGTLAAVAGFYLVLAACCAMVGSWIASGPGAHGSLPFSSSDSLDVLGRAIFAIGAVVIWLGLIAVAISGWRKRAGGKA
jgi:hypothetical protein